MNEIQNLLTTHKRQILAELVGILNDHGGVIKIDKVVLRGSQFARKTRIIRLALVQELFSVEPTPTLFVSDSIGEREINLMRCPLVELITLLNII